MYTWWIENRWACSEPTWGGTAEAGAAGQETDTLQIELTTTTKTTTKLKLKVNIVDYGDLVNSFTVKFQ